MKHVFIASTLALALMACNDGSGKKQGAGGSTETENTVQEAQPGGTIQVTILNREKDTSSVQFHFTVDTLRYERTFNDVPLIKGYDDSAIIRTLWDKPNSVWIGLIKPDRSTRYYHGSQDGRSLKINWVPSPPARIYEYVEKKLGLGKSIRNQPLVQQYKKNIQSGKIISDFVVELRPKSRDSVGVYMTFGGLDYTAGLLVPEGAKPYIQAYKDDNCFVGLQMNDDLVEIYEVKVIDGRLGFRQLKSVK